MHWVHGRRAMLRMSLVKQWALCSAMHCRQRGKVFTWDQCIDNTGIPFVVNFRLRDIYLCTVTNWKEISKVSAVLYYVLLDRPTNVRDISHVSQCVLDKRPDLFSFFVPFKLYCTLFCRLWSISAHTDNFIRRLSVRVCVSVRQWLSW